MIKKAIIYSMVAILLASCHSKHDNTHTHEKTLHNAEADDKPENHKHGHIDEISFTKEQAELASLTTATVIPASFHQVIKTSGHIQLPKGGRVTVAATTNGIVSYVNSSISEGIRVNAGEPIAIIIAKHLQDGDPATKARIEHETAKNEYQRAKTLVKDKIISEKEYEQALQRYEIAKTSYNAFALNTSTDGVNITSPTGGYIENLLVAQGEFVSVGQPIATISGGNRLQLRAEVSERYYKDLNSVVNANFKTAYDDKVYKLSELNGRVVSFGHSSGESSYLTITFEFDNNSNIVAGSYVEAYLLSEPRENIISVPINSITEQQGLYFVYLRVHEECYKKQEVTLGQSDGHRVEVISGLKEGDEVVTNGSHQVRLAGMESAIPEGHGHSH